MFVTPPLRNLDSKCAFPVWAILVISFLILTLHAINLTADTPTTFAEEDDGIRVDEGYKTLAPRNLVLFGSERWSEADQYRGWFKGSPLTQSLLYVTFSAAGANILVARATALIYFLVLMIIVFWGQRGYLSAPSLILVAALLATEPFLFFFSRLALFEVALAAFVAAALVAVRKLGPDRPWLPLVVVIILAFSAFMLVKVSAILYFLPAAGILALFGIRKSRPRQAVAITVLALAAVCVMLILTHETWMRRMTVPSPGTLISRVATNPMAAHSPWLTCAAWLCIADLVRERGRALLNDPYFLAITATVIGVPVLLCFFSYAPPRYFVAFVPAQILAVAYWLGKSNIGSTPQEKDWIVFAFNTAVLSIALFVLSWTVANHILPLTSIPQGDTPGISAPTAVKLLLPPSAALAVIIQLMGLSPKMARFILFRPVIYLLVIATIASGTYQASAIWLNPGYNSHLIRERLAQTVPLGEAVIGDHATFFALGTHIPATYSKTNQGEAILGICPSYYLYSGTKLDDTTVESYLSRAGVHLGEAMTLGEYAGQTITLHRLWYPEGSCE